MKTILKTIACSLLIVGSVNAQSVTDEASIITTKEYELNNESVITIKTVSKERRDMNFKAEDQGELNQSLEQTPIYVEKTIQIDNDGDAQFDKEIQLKYKKDIEETLNYLTTPDGIYITSSDSTPLFINKAGAYELDSKSIDNITIVVENLNTTK